MAIILAILRAIFVGVIAGELKATFIASQQARVRRAAASLDPEVAEDQKDEWLRELDALSDRPLAAIKFTQGLGRAARSIAAAPSVRPTSPPEESNGDAVEEPRVGGVRGIKTVDPPMGRPAVATALRERSRPIFLAMLLLTLLAFAGWIALSQQGAGPRESPQSVLQQAFDRPHSTASPTWADVCGSEPGYDAPSWAKTKLRALYLGGSTDRNAGAAPGASAGCTGPTLIARGGDGKLVYTVAKDASDSVRSVATVSKDFGSAIFLAPAAERVLGLIRTHHDIGGWPRTAAGRGDYYGVTTAEGTAILMRSGPVIDNGSGDVHGYVLLRPTAASLWMKAMRQHGSWLWAVPGGIQRNGEERIKLVDNLQTNEIVATIFVDRTAGTARVAGERPRGSTHGDDLSQHEVESYASRAQ